MLHLINPVRRPEPFDHPDWLFEAKFDGFRAAADTVHGQLISRNGNRMKRYEEVLDLLPQGYVFDGELVVLDDTGRPLFNNLLMQVLRWIISPNSCYRAPEGYPDRPLRRTRRTWQRTARRAQC